MTAQQPPRLLRGIPLAVRRSAQNLRFAASAATRSTCTFRQASSSPWSAVAVAAKSTLLRLLAGLDQATGGELLAGSAPLSEAMGRHALDVPGSASAAVEKDHR